jgi:hypothetical protein
VATGGGLTERSVDAHREHREINVVALQCGQLTPAQAAESRHHDEHPVSRTHGLGQSRGGGPKCRISCDTDRMSRRVVMGIVPAALCLGLGLGILIGTRLNGPADHPASWTAGYGWAQSHWSAYLANSDDSLSAGSAATWCNGAHNQTRLRKTATDTWTSYQVTQSWTWQQGCIARIRSAASN